MTEGNANLPWPGADDRIVVEEMKRDPISGQWYECREFVKRCVQKQATNIPKDIWDDIVQDAMIRVNKSLTTFHFVCSFRTWLFGIARSSVIDAYRKFTREGQHTAPPGDPHDTERDELSKALTALQEYVSTHANPVRNGRILDMVLLEGRSLEAAAKAVGCSAPMVGYVVRSAQHYVRDRLGYRR